MYRREELLLQLFQLRLSAFCSCILPIWAHSVINMTKCDNELVIVRELSASRIYGVKGLNWNWIFHFPAALERAKD